MGRTQKPFHQAPLTTPEAVEIRARFLVLGIVSVLLGIAAIGLPLIEIFAVEFILGTVLVIAGALDGAHAFVLRSKCGYILSWVSASVLFIAGLLLIYSLTAEQTTPRAGLPDPCSLPLALGVVFVVAGALRIGKGLDIRPIPNWRWVVFSGLLGVVIGFVILFEWRTLSLPFISVLAGISLIVDGWSRMVVFWLAGRGPTPEKTTNTA